MSLLGSNLLARAQALIPPVDVTLYLWQSDDTDDGGTVIQTYADGVPKRFTVQAVSRALYEKFGLDLQKEYRMIYASAPLRDLARGAGCDVIDYGGRRYSVESNTDWYLMNGWRGSLCVDTGPIPNPPVKP